MDMPTFDELMNLGQRDPDGFEVLRAELVEECIRSGTSRNQRRLRGFQFKIDAKRQMAASPMKALLDIQGMMYDSLLSLQQSLLAEGAPSKQCASTGGRVLLFRRALSKGEDEL